MPLSIHGDRTPSQGVVEVNNFNIDNDAFVSHGNRIEQLI